jgi:hypothetical protein
MGVFFILQGSILDGNGAQQRDIGSKALHGLVGAPTVDGLREPGKGLRDRLLLGHAGEVLVFD